MLNILLVELDMRACFLFSITTLCSKIISARRSRSSMEVPVEVSSPNIEFVENEPTRFQNFLSRFREIRNAEAHFSLRNALIDHLREEYSNTV
ncbi:hypothetical protein ACS0TY_007217 [Phlomoides rotata]